MAKTNLGKNGVLGAFKLAVLLTLVLGTVWFIYNYLQTGSFSLYPRAMITDGGGGSLGGRNIECYTNRNCLSKKPRTVCDKSTHTCVRPQKDPSKCVITSVNCTSGTDVLKSVCDFTFPRATRVITKVVWTECDPPSGYTCKDCAWTGNSGSSTRMCGASRSEVKEYLGDPSCSQ